MHFFCGYTRVCWVYWCIGGTLCTVSFSHTLIPIIHYANFPSESCLAPRRNLEIASQKLSNVMFNFARSHVLFGSYLNLWTSLTVLAKSYDRHTNKSLPDRVPSGKIGRGFRNYYRICQLAATTSKIIVAVDFPISKSGAKPLSQHFKKTKICCQTGA